MVKFGKMKKILSLFLGAMSFGTQGAYAGKKKNVNGFDVSVSSKSKGKGRDTKGIKGAKKKDRSKGKNAKTRDGRRVGRVNVNGDEALRIVKEAKSKGHKVNMKKIGRDKAEVTVTDEHGNVVTYIVSGVIFLLLIAAIVGVVLKCKGAAGENGDQGPGGNPNQEDNQGENKDEEKKKKEEEEEKKKEEKKKELINEIKGLCEIYKKFESTFEVDGLGDLDISSLESKKSDLEGLIGGKRDEPELASKVKFMLEFKGDKRGLDDLSNDDFAGVYDEFKGDNLAGLVYDMVTKLDKAIADDTIAVWGDNVTPLELLGFGSCDNIRKVWDNLDEGSIENLSSTFNEWLKGKSWMKQEGTGFLGIGKLFSKKGMIKGTTFKEYWDSK